VLDFTAYTTDFTLYVHTDSSMKELGQVTSVAKQQDPGQF